MSQNQPIIIGWKESVNLPDWGIMDITAKADTGARRSALDVQNIEELPGNRVQFDIVLNRINRDFTRTITAPIAHQTHVRSSNGQQHERYFVETRIQILDVVRSIELSLVNRKNMSCRMLIGRKALEGSFLVDSQRTHILRPNKKLRVTDTNPNSPVSPLAN